MNRERMLTVTRTDLYQLRKAKDFWIPMAILAALFYVIIPTIILFALDQAEQIQAVQKFGATLDATVDLLPQAAKESVRGDTPVARAQFMLSVYMFAPLAIIVPLTISTAVGANTIVGEREKGTGEFLAHSPASEAEIYTGKLIASILPGYLAGLAGFGVYALLVNLLVGPNVGGWFFPTPEWLVLLFWEVPPFIMLALTAVLRISARVRSATASQQASGLVTLPLILLSYAQASGAVFGNAKALWIVGGVAWILAILGLWRGQKAVTRERLLGVDVSN